MNQNFIEFGVVYEYVRDPSRKYVIVDEGEETWFLVSELLNRGRLGSIGTSLIIDLGEIIGKMSLDEVVIGLQKSLGKFKTPLATDNIYCKLVESNSKTGRSIVR